VSCKVTFEVLAFHRCTMHTIVTLCQVVRAEAFTDVHCTYAVSDYGNCCLLLVFLQEFWIVSVLLFNPYASLNGMCGYISESKDTCLFWYLWHDVIQFSFNLRLVLSVVVIVHSVFFPMFFSDILSFGIKIPFHLLWLSCYFTKYSASKPCSYTAVMFTQIHCR